MRLLHDDYCDSIQALLEPETKEQNDNGGLGTMRAIDVSSFWWYCMVERFSLRYPTGINQMETFGQSCHFTCTEEVLTRLTGTANRRLTGRARAKTPPSRSRYGGIFYNFKVVYNIREPPRHTFRSNVLLKRLVSPHCIDCESPNSRVSD